MVVGSSLAAVGTSAASELNCCTQTPVKILEVSAPYPSVDSSFVAPFRAFLASVVVAQPWYDDRSQLALQPSCDASVSLLSPCPSLGGRCRRSSLRLMVSGVVLCCVLDRSEAYLSFWQLVLAPVRKGTSVFGRAMYPRPSREGGSKVDWVDVKA